MPSPGTIWSCERCRREEDADCFLRSLASWHPGTDTVTHRCGRCGHTDPARVRPGAVILGYIYGAGSAHFSEEEQVACPKLGVARDPDGLSLEWPGGALRLPAVR
jgi:predicted RNA-binding Zn-ribbon protein involved in translation (DUF1610 family)